eukprot:TRINITY_DN13414_c0_g1_i1.p1 TRINITY_DN13414_c0_g1~~TRINITY_DN13414_c0_g1_i1.p1  ORF type:complete len:547 (+),score=161.49 TRINITY_DN13414_c0_g1_i1:49-1641(+)
MEGELDGWRQRVRRGEDVGPLLERLPEVFELLARGSSASRDAAEQLVRALTQRSEGRALIASGALDELFAAALDPSKTDAQCRCACADVLKTACRAVTAAPGPGLPAFRPELLQLIAQCLQDPDVGVTAKAEACLTHILLHRTLREDTVVQATFFPAILGLVSQNDEVSVRVLEGVAQALGEEADKKHTKRVEMLERQHRQKLANPDTPVEASNGHVEVYDNEEEIFETLQQLGVLDSIADGVVRATEDVLLLLNYMEVLEAVTRSAYGVAFCATRSALGERLAGLARQNVVESVSGFSLRFIGNFAQHSPENCAYALNQGWYQLAQGFAKALANDLGTCRGIEALAGVAATPCGLQRLAEEKDFFSVFVTGALSPHADVKEAALHGAAAMLESPFNLSVLAQPDTFASLFDPDCYASKAAISKVLQLRSHAVQSVRLATLRFIAALSRHRGAVPFLTTCQLMWDWLVDPDVEMDVMCKETKYGGIQHLAKNAEFIDRDAKDVMELRVAAKMGPYYTKRSTRAPMLDYED